MARQANQNFKLKQAPALTYTRSTAPGGMESSLQIRVNDLLWHEVPTLFGRGSRERVFTTEHGGRRLGHGALWRWCTWRAFAVRRAERESDLSARERFGWDSLGRVSSPVC